MKRRRKNAPRAPNFNVHIRAQAAVYKSGRFFSQGLALPWVDAPNFEIGARGFGQLQPAFEMGVFCENHGTPIKGLLGTLIMGVRGAVHMLRLQMPLVCKSSAWAGLGNGEQGRARHGPRQAVRAPA